MNGLQTTLQWFSGGEDQYHPLTHCMQSQWFWITTTVALDVAVAVGYVRIAFHWRKNELTLPPSPARRALATMRNIFTFCGICGYLFIPVELVWPAWRLYDLFMLALVFFTWRYALNVKGLKVLYSAVGRSDRLESELSDARDEARRKGAFLNAISHDLRTPLNGLMLNAHLAELHLVDGNGNHEDMSRALTEIKAAAQLTADLLDGLLEYARVEGAGDRVVADRFPLSELVAEVLSAHAHGAAAAGLDVSAAVPPSLTVRTDRLKVARVLHNLVGNAVKFTPAGSVRVTAEAAGPGLEIHVTDTGVGIAAEHVGHMFDEFYQVDNDERDRRKGFGLGLAIGRQLARQLGGDVTVASTVGRGSRFTLALPSAVCGAADVQPVLAHDRPRLAADERGAADAGPADEPVVAAGGPPAGCGRPPRPVG